jgi:hypothetical protein
VIGKEAAARRRKGFRTNSDIGDLDRSTISPSRHQQVAWLTGGESHGAGSLHDRSSRLARFTIEPRRQIDGQDRLAGAVHSLDRPPGQAFEVPSEARAEQSIDDEIGLMESRVIDSADVPGPILHHLGRISCQAIQRAEQRNGHLVASSGQKSRGNESVAAILPWP